VTLPLTGRSERGSMEGLCGHCVGTYGGVYDLSAEQVGHTHPTGLMQSFPISGPRWEGMLLDCITILPRVQSIDCMCAGIDQLSEFTHFPVISLEYGATWVTEISLGEILEFMSNPESLSVIGTTGFLAHVGRSCSYLQAQV
jgi:hypothetical protein